MWSVRDEPRKSKTTALEGAVRGGARCVAERTCACKPGGELFGVPTARPAPACARSSGDFSTERQRAPPALNSCLAAPPAFMEQLGAIRNGRHRAALALLLATIGRQTDRRVVAAGEHGHSHSSQLNNGW